LKLPQLTIKQPPRELVQLVHKVNTQKKVAMWELNKFDKTGKNLNMSETEFIQKIKKQLDKN